MSYGNLGSLLPIATFQMTMDNIPAGPLVVESQNVLDSTPQGDLSWISGTVLGRHFSGTYSEPTRRLTIGRKCLARTIGRSAAGLFTHLERRFARARTIIFCRESTAFIA
ncbi:MAG: hypothetical protein DMG32_23680 [Acidobacteria bacterium]|nr:MAG: hypothetical protein DMG32_23680 [Acidobacteriota bacterium]